MADGFKPVTLQLPSLAPPLVLEVLPSGLTLHRLYVQADGRTHDILVGPENPTDHANFPYTNTIIGRYTNRLPVGEHALQHASTGTSGTLTVKANPISGSPRVQLHGGVEGFDKRVFAQLPVAEARLFSAKERAAIGALPAAELWTYTSPAGEEDFPGALRLEVLTALLSAPSSDGAQAPTATSPDAAYPLGSVLLLYRAALEPGAQGPTPINLTQHWGFNLDASLAGRAGKAAYGAPHDLVRTHTLHMAADGVLALDGDNNSAGTLDAVAGTGHDFRAPKHIEKGIPGRGYDDFYAFEQARVGGKHTLSAGSLEQLDEVTPLVGAPGALGAPLVTLAGAKSGLTTQFWSNQSGVQFYTANFYDRSNARKKIHGGAGAPHTGDGYGPHSAAFLEFHEPLAAFLPQNAGSVRSGWDTLLAPGEVYHNWVRLDVLCKSVPEDAL